MKKICKFCRKEFLTKYENQQFCSHNCHYEYKKSLRIKVICEYCGKEFYRRKSEIIKRKTICCSTQCSIHLRRKYKLKNYKNLYIRWKAIISRCSNILNKSYDRYGGRGIKICQEWQDDFINFYNWAIENGYQENLTIDRINNNRSYSPDNCRWVDIDTQARNKRNNIVCEYNNKKYIIKDLADELKLNYKKLLRHYHETNDIFKAIEFSKIKRLKNGYLHNHSLN